MPVRTAQAASCLLALAAFAFGASPQETNPPAARPEIRGLVLEPGTNQPVTEAEISLYFLGAEAPRVRVGLGTLQAAGATQTDSTGAFSFPLDKVGYYAVAAKKENYSAPANAPSSQNVTLTAEEPAKEVRLFLSRPGQLTGRVVDEETGKPITGLRVMAGRARDFAGHRLYMGIEGTTGADGQFLIPNLTPGEYVAIIRPQRQSKERVIANFSEKDLETVDQDFALSYWPGGHGQDTAAPVLMGSGATVDIGEAHVKKTPYYRVHVHVPASNCVPGDTMQVYDQAGGTGIGEITQQAPCGKDMLIAGFPPGEHRLILASNGGRRGTRSMASVAFVIGDENIGIIAPMAIGVTVDASFVAEDGARPPDFTKLGLALYPMEMLPFLDLAMPQAPDAAGKIRLTGVPTVPHRIMLSGLDAGHYVKEIRYNGIPIAGENLPLDKGAMSYSLAIVIDDKPAAIVGSVTTGDNPVSQPHVLLAKWPPPGDRPLQTRAAEGDDKGKFQFAGLAPGEYRMVALRSSEEDTNRAPGTLERAMATATKIEVGPSAFQNVTLELTELR